MNQVLAPAASKKRILLVVSDDVRRDLRARVLRKLGADVECAADISEARSLWRADFYNLVLFDVVRDARNAEEFCAEVKTAKPPQAVAFLVGKPDYIAASPRSEGPAADGDINGHGAWGEVVASLFASACEGLSRRWGFQEAAWRIAAARSVKDPSRNQPRGDAKLPARSHAKPVVPSWAQAMAQHTAFTSAIPPVTSMPVILGKDIAAAAGLESDSDLHLEKIG
ncbi:MAG TPA: response regulator [Terriglobales bacterium]|nr:response regulator [Terriglobales bacterium]